MEVSKKLIELDQIIWPVFKLGTRDPEIDNGIYYINNEYITDSSEIIVNSYIIDNKNIKGKNIGMRRLNIDKDKLYPLRIAIYTIQDLIKLSCPKTWFIDTSGILFKYKKTTRAKLETHDIIQILPVNGIGCILEIKGFSERFKSLTVPGITQKYAAILTYKGKYLLYGLSSEKIKATWRLV